jgi:CRP-like cAMP-binding protein
MHSHFLTGPVRQLQQREVLSADDIHVLWRVESGALRVDSAQLDESCSFVHLALPGDVIGIESLLGGVEPFVVRALTPAALVPVDAADEDRVKQLLLDAVGKGYLRCRALVLLRTGSPQERVKRLLLMLANTDDSSIGEAAACALPSLSDMAAIVNVAPETVCRALANLRQSNFLQDCSPQISKHQPLELRTHRLQPGVSLSRVGKMGYSAAICPL